ncbi:MAG TPA: lysine-2,3-aminomutase-like protein [Pseudolabrys sp.]|nr:lysine-2,3-aminomutase-like protein [Pseudolabrys sp.]
MKSGTLRKPAEFVEEGFASADRLGELERIASRYATALPLALADLIDKSDPHDPIARQFVPDAAELEVLANESADPIGDDTHSPIAGIVHRYPDRVLLKLVQVCAVYCRFCFRREMVGPGKPNALSAAAVNAALDYIRSHEEIWEVILTGGDPLVLSPRRLRSVMRQLATIDHVKIVRIHTRMPIADPGRLSADMVRAMSSKAQAVYVAVHVNHARELTALARAACARIVDAGIPMLSQSVLLAGVNDTPEALGALMRALVECRIKPYYLHHGDLAPGTSHLRTNIESGRALMRALHGRLSGLCQPTYVLDIPGGYGKSPIGPCYLEPARDGAKGVYDVQDFNARRHRYPPEPSRPVGRNSVPDGNQIEQRGGHRETRKADEDDCDDGVPDE